MEDQKRRVTIAFDLAADTYDHPVLRCFDEHAHALVRAAEVRPGTRVLDVATGTGKVTLEAARLVGPKGQVVGIDLSEGMLAQARQKAGGLPVEFRRMDAEHLEFADGAFDTVVCGFGIFFLPDMVRGISEMHRVLRPGGRVALTVWTRQTFEPMTTMTIDRTVRYGLPPVPASPEPWMELQEPDHVRTLLENGNFREIQVVPVSEGYLIEPEDWWTFLWGSGPRGRLRQLSPEALARFRAETLEEIRRLRGERGVWLDTSALIGVGLR